MLKLNLDLAKEAGSDSIRRLRWKRTDRTRASFKKLRKEEKSGRRAKGKLKIFLGYAAGVGKTYAMLEAAQTLRDRGQEVVAGYIEPP